MNIFCYLPKDQKTFDILKKYMEDIKIGMDLMKEDSRIQAKEIIEHNIRENCNDTMQWVEDHGVGERLYLNSVKELATLFIATEREITWENFEFFIDKLNSINECLLSKIHFVDEKPKVDPELIEWLEKESKKINKKGNPKNRAIKAEKLLKQVKKDKKAYNEKLTC